MDRAWAGAGNFLIVALRNWSELPAEGRSFFAGTRDPDGTYHWDTAECATDAEGRVLAASDYYTTGQQVMVAYVPTHGVRTIYSVSGDLFAWLCMAALVGLVALAIVERRARSSSAPASLPQPAR